MRVLIAGGTGVIGSAAVAQLAADGHEIIILSRNPAEGGTPPGVRLVAWDARTAAGWGDWMDGADAVINLAGQPISSGTIPTPWTEEYKRKIALSRQQAGEALVAAIDAAKHKPAVLFQGSGIDYYPYGNKVMTEEDPPGTQFLAQVVADYWEPSTAPVEAMGVRRVIGRMGPLLNLENGPLPSSLLQFKLFAGGRLGSGKQWLSWVHIDDAIGAMLFLLSQETAHGVYNIVAPTPVTNAEYTAALGEVMKRPTLIPVPEFAMRTLLGEVSELVLKGRPVSSEKIEAAGFTFRFPTIEAALSDLVRA